VTRDIILIGAGLGVTFPLTLVVVQAGLPHQLVGVATSQITFWRSLGGTIGTAVLGSILTNHLPVRPTRLDLASTLHELFFVVSLVVSVFLREVPLTKESQTPIEEIEGIEVAA
jgi:MFS family permease